MKLGGTIEIAAPAAEVWARMVDPRSLAACVPGVGDVLQVDEQTFQGTVTASVGPIEGRFAFTSVLVEEEFPDRLVVRVEGVDSVTKSRLIADVESSVADRGAADTVLTYRANVAVKGRLAILGEMVLRATANAMIGQVTRCLRDQLEAAASR
ncbi:MAG TPA: SRPBCC domain-containing protein [Candidatus Limnocylindrales bacterium]|nr:SRPBCC domain-containing protein [Candidatus Limnocylindrales bacterium]